MRKNNKAKPALAQAVRELWQMYTAVIVEKFLPLGKCRSAAPYQAVPTMDKYSRRISEDFMRYYVSLVVEMPRAILQNQVSVSFNLVIATAAKLKPLGSNTRPCHQ